MSRFLKTLKWCLLVGMIGGCSTTNNTAPDYRSDHQKSTTEQPLEIPPDLIGSTEIDDQQMAIPEGRATLSDHNNQGQSIGVNVLPQLEGMQIKHEGSARWLVVQAKPNMIWPKVKQFWRKQGFKLTLENPKIGIIETEWRENRADIPQDGVRKYLGKIIGAVYSASTRDKFRVRIERSNVEDATELYLTHQGAEEVTQGDTFVWQGRPSDPELEAEMLNRLMVFIGLDKKQADMLQAKTDEPVSRADLIRSKKGQVSLIVHQDFALVWRRIGLALDRLEFTIEDHDRSRGVYFIRYIDPYKKNQGFFSRLFGGDSTSDNQEYLIVLEKKSSTTRIVVENSKGQVEINKTAEKILTLLHEQLQ